MRSNQVLAEEKRRLFFENLPKLVSLVRIAEFCGVRKTKSDSILSYYLGMWFSHTNGIGILYNPERVAWLTVQLTRDGNIKTLVQCTHSEADSFFIPHGAIDEVIHANLWQAIHLERAGTEAEREKERKRLLAMLPEGHDATEEVTGG